jgi:ATP-dependent protease HslVU (ClpYQ) peptidase subunit
VATVGKIVSKVAGFAGSRADLLAALEQNEEGLQEIAEDFSRICGKYSMTSFYESNKLLGVKQV